MTKVIAAFIIIIALYGGWHLFLYWDKVKHEEEVTQKQAASSTVDPRGLPGLPQNLEGSLEAAQKQGPNAFRNWLKTYSSMLQDPRKAWIELEYCVAVRRDDPTEAKRVFAEVRDRTPATSPVYARIKQLEPTFK